MLAHTNSNSNQHVSARLTGHKWFLTFCSQAKIINIVKMLHFVFCVRARHKICELWLQSRCPRMYIIMGHRLNHLFGTQNFTLFFIAFIKCTRFHLKSELCRVEYNQIGQSCFEWARDCERSIRFEFIQISFNSNSESIHIMSSQTLLILKTHKFLLYKSHENSSLICKNQ